ncbi:MAG: aminotransferase class I/II-fold pyridoxal phosphate-dependent enzyme [Blastocatellia bacterium]|nr:aminotransferase class I/II-fold pyridoxal phosphate-dependent enzyme [Blastocatellia bacterium]MCS7156538.1 aminotransferase class I/II-fold pyridoxal phosphate-dependent enzyme [Blastocatellia bacterium]MCX7751721.1 aminotransferase class I/II-fold pyridoxal phosphate-dependent enzyme [Blastocatellia bacterium]MDW8168822.1 aminotransferase class I/II-fold pyridoxal phosphate-dependent enzyme [Acidobacteriota bacterium]MDW8257464.1 aminotransferase class I/II-fold pyridoxal phosphate-depend
MERAMAGGAVSDMPLEDFRRFGHQVVEWIADYLAGIERYPVLARVRPGEIRQRLSAHPPREGESLEVILRDFEQVVLPGITHWNHPGFMAYFAITGSGPGILGELLAAALNVNAMLWKTSPAATELEQVVLDWLRQMLGLPPEFEGIIYDTASISSLCALAAAREALGLGVREEGLAGRAALPRLRIYASEEAHSSIEKAAIVLGFGQAGVRKIPTDEAFRMDVSALERAIEEDRAMGWRPCCVVATVGTTSTTSSDPVPEIARVCERYGVWLHVDAAYAGAAAIVPEFRHVLDGCERADSLVVNPHKWLFTPMDLSAFYCRRMDVLRRAFSLVPEYLRTEEEGVRNFMDYGPQLGRRFRALKLWMVIRYFGQEGLAARIREHIRLAQQFAAWVDADPDFERVAPTPLSTVCFRARPQSLALSEADLDRFNAALLEAINATGECFLSHTRIRGRLALRLAIGNVRTNERHVQRAWELLRAHAARLRSEWPKA